MARSLQYTTLAHRYTAKFPAITYVGIQANFWILANLLLLFIVRLYSLFISEVMQLPLPGDFGSMIWIAIGLGLLYGTGIGLAGYYLDKRYFRKLPLGLVIIYKVAIAISLFTLMLLVLKFVVLEIFISRTLTFAGFRLHEKSWDYLFYLLLTYYFVMTLVISFINQVNTKYGPGVLVPLLLGRYRTPRDEERIFMFMDLKSSTTIAERLGHLKYSAMIRDCFADINEVLYAFRAQVYQYAGDEIIVMWPTSEGLQDARCIRFYFAVTRQFQRRSRYFHDTYGVVPVFKAGMHMGIVTAVEIGEIKKDIAYHGDTLNTAARIQALCSPLGRNFLVSKRVIDGVDRNELLTLEYLGLTELKGRSEKIDLVAVDSKPF
jgi:adenylate cyclase